MTTAKDVLKMIKDHGVEMVDLKFVDFLGTWQHKSHPINMIDEDVFVSGLGFDGSSIRGWQGIQESDMLQVPDPATARIDPFMQHPTLSMICDIVDPITKEPYSRDPRNIAKKAEAYLKASGVGDIAYFGPEPEFFIFDDARYEVQHHKASFSVDSGEAHWNSNRDEGGNLGYKIRQKEGYFPVAPYDTQQDIRTEMCLVMQKVGIAIETHHHEVATAGQAEIDMVFDQMLPMADKVMWYKYICRNVARRHGKVVTFMPKPISGDNGSGMHTHQSIWKGGKNLFAGDGYGGLSQFGLHYIGGILKHAKALNAFTNPTLNSYRRLVPGFEAPVSLAYSCRNRSASCRIPMYSQNPKSKRVEVRFPDAACNPYIAFAAMLMAGLDGVQNKIDPGDALDKNLYDLPPEELANVPQACGSLEEALEALEKDHKFLLKGDVFTKDVVETQIAWKQQNELDTARFAVPPIEHKLYFDVG
ncbi:MAG: type I glutamate--ammonia ligase [Deltaproteobacteria bacterium]|nr:type I glutamate--ammonia ligase [Deltaproteobacteria bacterium]